MPSYDTPHALFFIDPPYFGNEADYGEGMFNREDFIRLKDILGGLKGRFIMSLNDKPEVRDIFADFDIEAVTLSYTISRGAATKAKEVIISN